MLIDIDCHTYNNYFKFSKNPFISEPFLSINEHKVDKVLRLIENTKRVSLGLVLGVSGKVLKSPFSAPFGGFHFNHEDIYTYEIDNFLESLKNFVSLNGFNKIELILPPDIYHPSFNAKMINSLLRNNFSFNLPEITSFVDLDQFKVGQFKTPARKNFYNQAVAHKLTFHSIFDDKEREKAYELVRENRARLNRPIYMTFNDLEIISKQWKIDFFKVIDNNGQMVASAMFYLYHPTILYAVFWGDTEHGRKLRAMDFMIHKLWEYYKADGFKYIDLSTSTLAGIPNIGLLRFKEQHYATSSLRFSSYWDSKE